MKNITENGVTRELYYIGSPDDLAAVYQKDAIQGGKMYYAHTDHQGSIVSLTDSIGGKVFQASYDAWGKQTVSLNTIGFYRGYTGHEHLPEFGLINMNGRMYDPVLGRFLSPDNYVQAPDLSQNFNRYSYCLNNPLKFTDPDGNNPLIIAGLIVGSITGIINLAAHWNQVDNFWDGAAAFGIGFGAGFIGTLSGGMAFAAAGGTAIGGGGFVAGMIGGGVGFSYSTTFQTIGNGAYFGDPMPTTSQLLKGAGFSMAFGGTLQGLNALAHGRDFLYGNPIGNGVPTPGPIPNLDAGSQKSELNVPNARTELAQPSSGGRLGNAATRDQIGNISNELESRGYTIARGGGRFPEEYLKPIGGGRSGGSYLDITATHPSYQTLRINTVDIYKSGMPTIRELNNALRIRQQIPLGEHLLLLPKR